MQFSEWINAHGLEGGSMDIGWGTGTCSGFSPLSITGTVNLAPLYSSSGNGEGVDVRKVISSAIFIDFVCDTWGDFSVLFQIRDYPHKLFIIKFNRWF